MPQSPQRNGVIRAFETVATTDVPASPRGSEGDLFIDAVYGANKVIEAVAKQPEGPAPREYRPNPCIPLPLPVRGPCPTDDRFEPDGP